jgi:hypothetical protein
MPYIIRLDWEVVPKSDRATSIAPLRPRISANRPKLVVRSLIQTTNMIDTTDHKEV